MFHVPLSVGQFPAVFSATPHTLFGLVDTQIEALATVVIAGLTLVYVFVATCQLLAMRAALKEAQKSGKEILAETIRSNEARERSYERGQRSWLVATSFKAPKTFTAGVPTEVVMTIANVGLVPATVIGTARSVGLTINGGIPANLAELPDDSRTGKSFRAVVGSGYRNRLLLTATLRPLTEDEVAAIEPGSNTLFAYCRIRYTDCFVPPGDFRKTTACWRFDAEMRDWDVIGEFNSAP